MKLVIFDDKKNENVVWAEYTIPPPLTNNSYFSVDNIISALCEKFNWVACEDNCGKLVRGQDCVAVLPTDEQGFPLLVCSECAELRKNT